MRIARRGLVPLLLLLLLSPASGATLEELIARYHREKGEVYKVRYKTLQEISALGTEGAFRFLVTVVEKDEQFAVRMYAIGQLGRIAHPSGIAAILRLWKSAEDNEKPSLLSAMMDHQKLPGVRKIVTKVREGSEYVLRATLIRWLGEQGDERFLPEAERYLEDFPRQESKLIPALTSAKTPAAARLLVRIYDDTDNYHLIEVPKVFARGEEDVQQVLVDALESGNEQLVANAISLTIRARLALAEPALVALLSGARRERKALLIEAVAAVGARTTEGRTAILKAIGDKDAAVANAGIRAARQAPFKEAIPVLIRVMEGAKGALRKEIGATLEKATGQQFGDRADLWRKWWDTYGEEFDPDEVRKPEPGAVDTELVNLAIDRGAAALKSIRGEREPWKYSTQPVGTTALVCLALHAAGVDRKDRDLREGVEYILETTLPDHTYSVSLVAMALEAVGGKRYKSRVAECARRLVSTQMDYGYWGYPHGDGDNSNTQYAVLGLRAAARAGVRVPQRTWRRVCGHFLETRNPDGGWGYKFDKRYASSASMTAGGVSSLLICLENMKLDETEQESLIAEIDRGFDALGEMMKLDKDSLYALYGIERSGVLGRKQEMAGKPWYAPGAKRLLSEQDPKGFWRGAYNEAVDTSFAILFLKKATVPIATK